VAARKQKAGTKQKRMPARTVEDEDYHLRHERVAGIDVAKASGMICLRLPPEGGQGKRFSKVWESGATVPEAEAFRDAGGRRSPGAAGERFAGPQPAGPAEDGQDHGIRGHEHGRAGRRRKCSPAVRMLMRW
jgi:hypothetical protein